MLAAGHRLFSKRIVDNALDRLLKSYTPFHRARVQGNRSLCAVILPRLATYEAETASQLAVTGKVIDQHDVGVHCELEAAYLISTQTDLQQSGLFQEHICSKLQHVYDSYTSIVFGSRGDVSDGTDHNSFRLNLREAVRLTPGGGRLRGARGDWKRQG